MVHLIVIDTETGGLFPHEHCIIELSAKHVIVDHDKRRVGVGSDHFHRFVKPDRPVHPQAAAINGYSEEKWRGAQRMNHVAEAFFGWLTSIPFEDLIWTGQNVTGFDLPFLRGDLDRCGMKLPGKPKFARRVLNTESLCFPLLVKGDVAGVGLSDLRVWAGESGDQHHTASKDVDDTIAVIMRYFTQEVWRE